MQPAFHRERVAAYGPAMVERGGRMLERWKDGETRDVHRDLMRLTLEIAAETLFGASVESDAERVSAALDVLMDANTSTRRLLPLARHLPTADNRRYSAAVGELDRIVYRIISQRRAEMGAEAAGVGARRSDLLSLLLQAQDDDGSRMNDRQLRDECITLLLAGHETTALALTWTAYLLASDSAVQKKFHAELDRVFGGPGIAGRAPRVEDVGRLPYTECILRESLRLYPPAWLMPRVAAEACEIHGYHVPKGASVLVSQYIVHRDPRYFSEPERFDPGRWTEAFARGLPRFAYFPFGGGPRLCIGNNFALLEATLLLALLGQRFRLGQASSAPAEPMASITLRPKDGVRLTISRR
jgi:cytochrome P450